MSRYLGWIIAIAILALQAHTVFEVRVCSVKETWLNQEVKTLVGWRKGVDPEIQRLKDRHNWTREQLEAMIGKSINESMPLRDIIVRWAKVEARRMIQERVKTECLKTQAAVPGGSMH